MRAIIWLIRLLLFFLLFGFAIKNDHLVTLNFFFGVQWQLPLVFVILVSFAAGALLGVTATLASLMRQRREISRLRRQLELTEREKASTATALAAAEAQLPMVMIRTGREGSLAESSSLSNWSRLSPPRGLSLRPSVITTTELMKPALYDEVIVVKAASVVS